MFRANILVNYVLIGVVLPLALLTVLSPCSAIAQGQYNFLVPPTFTGSGNIFVADFNGDGKPDLLDSYGNLQLGNGDGTFTNGTQVTQFPLAVADFNGDGKPDVLEKGAGFTLLVLLGNGDGTFQAPISSNSGANLTGIAVGDLNGDGKADVVGVFNDSLLVYLNNGDGTFAAGVPYNLGTSAGYPPITLGDFNGDKKTDLVVSVEGNNGPGQEIVFLGNGDGTFQTAITSPGVDGPFSVVTGDFNGDGKLDLAISFFGNPPSVSPSASLLLGNGDGTFQTPTVVIPNTYGYLAVADLNGDSKLDLILQSLISESFPWAEIYLGNGDGTFSNTHSYFLQDQTFPSSRPVVADFNLDRKPDIAVGNYLLLGNGNGTFQGLGGLPLLSGNCQCAALGGGVVGNFDKNAAPYIAAAVPGISSSNLYILSSDATATLALAHTYALQQQTLGTATADLNGDSNLDLLAVSAGGYSVLLGNGDGSFQPPVFYQLANGGSQFGMVIADFNRDGKLDLAIPAGNQSVAVLLGNGDGTFGAPIYTFDGSGAALVSADFNGDGKPDLAAIGASGIAILLGNGDGTFQTATFITTNAIGFVLFTADVNGDGKPDLITNYGQEFLGNGDGTFTPQSAGQLAIYALADINGDGKLDAIGPQLLGPYSVCCGFYLGNGNGTFGSYIPVVEYPTDKIRQFVPAFVLAADMNGDGKHDVIMGGNSIPGVFVLINTTTPVTVNLWPASLNFSEPVGVTSIPSVTTLTNTGSLPLTISSIGITGANSGDFNQTNDCSNSLPVAGTCNIQVTFTPTAVGNRRAAVTITDNAPKNQQSVQLSGTGQGTTVTLTPTSLSFPAEPIGVTSPAQPVTLTVGGDTGLSLSNITTMGDFTQTNNCPSSISVGAGCTISVTFKPTVAGVRSGSLVVTDNVPGSPQSIPLSGTAEGLALSVASGSSNSATVPAGSMATYNLSIGGGGFSATASLTCTGAPQGASCSFPSGSTMNVSGSSASPFDFTVTTTSRSIATFSPTSTGSRLWLWAFVLIGVIILPNVKHKRRSAWQMIRLWPLVVLVLLCACGGGSAAPTNPNGTPVGTYPLTVKATSGSTSQSLALTLTVQ